MRQEIGATPKETDDPSIPLKAHPEIPEVPLDRSAEIEAPIDLSWEVGWPEKYGLSESEFKDLLIEAKSRVFSMGVGDVTSQIGELVSQFFVAKMIYVQKRLGLPSEAYVIQAPDATIQTSKDKFPLVVPESAKIGWGGSDFIPAELEFDFCGMGAVGINKYMDAVALASNVLEMKRKLRTLDGRELDTNCIVYGNHFTNIYEVMENEKHDLPPYIGMTHLSSEEFRQPLMDFVRRNAQKMETPFGVCLVLQGDKARWYWETVEEGNNFALKKRDLLTQEIFRSDYKISNEQHYTMLNPNTCIIGCNQVKEDVDFHVIVTNAKDEAYLVKGKRNVSARVLQHFSIDSSLPIYNDLRRADILPHASGQKLVEDVKFQGVKLAENDILYVTTLPNGVERVVRHYNGVPTTSRGSIIDQVLKYDLVDGDYVTLKPLCSVKV